MGPSTSGGGGGDVDCGSDGDGGGGGGDGSDAMFGPKRLVTACAAVTNPLTMIFDFPSREVGSLSRNPTRLPEYNGRPACAR